MSPPPATRRRAVLISLAALAAGVALWSAAWLLIAARLESGVEGWIGARRAEGWQASHGTVKLGGFPHRWWLRIERPGLSRPPGARAEVASWAGPWIELGWAPWASRRVRLRTAGAHDFGFAGGTGGRLRLTARDITGWLELGDGGAITRIDVGGDTLTVIPPGAPRAGGPFRVNRIMLRADLRPDAVPADAAPPPWLALDADILGLTLPARIGTPLGWGLLTVGGAGTLALDAGLQPIGALATHIAGYGYAIDRLTRAGTLSLGQRLAARLALGALARRPKGGGRPEVRAAISIQNRRLAVGPIPLLRLGRIRWR